MVSPQQPTPAPGPPPGHVRTVLDGHADDADLVDRIFAYLLELCPEIGGDRTSDIKAALRDEFVGQKAWVNKRSRGDMARQVLALFNGRNASEVARRLDISRATVYRLLKQGGVPPTDISA